MLLLHTASGILYIMVLHTILYMVLYIPIVYIAYGIASSNLNWLYNQPYNCFQNQLMPLFYSFKTSSQSRLIVGEK